MGILDGASSVFLETTIQIDLIIGRKERRDEIRHNLVGKQVSTSGHVLGEFNKTLIMDAITFRNLLISSDSVEDAVKRLRRYDRRFPRTVDLFATLGIDNDKQNTIDRLEKFIEWQAYECFWEFISAQKYVDRVGCKLKEWKPQNDGTNGYDTTGLKCLKDNPSSCKILSFIEANRAILENFVQYSKESNRRNIRRAATALENILSGAETPFGERSNCYAITDTMIVLESLADSQVYSTDGDVEIICQVIGRRKYQEMKVGS